MALLIRRGMLMTMGPQGSFTGDVLIRDGRIADVAPVINDAEGCQELDAGGLTVMPGLIDAHMHGSNEETECLSGMMLDAGITGGLVWHDNGSCTFLRGWTVQQSPVTVLKIREHPGTVLAECLREISLHGGKAACEICSEADGRRILQAVKDAGVSAILVHLSGCEEILEEIAASGCDVVIGVCRRWGNSPWRMAARLDALGVRVAVTCDYPAAMLQHLPVCASLCVRDGMPPAHALQTITTSPAAMLGLNDSGRIAPGCRADLALYDGDPLLLATSHVLTICGEKVHRRRF